MYIESNVKLNSNSFHVNAYMASKTDPDSSFNVVGVVSGVLSDSWSKKSTFHEENRKTALFSASVYFSAFARVNFKLFIYLKNGRSLSAHKETLYPSVYQKLLNSTSSNLEMNCFNWTGRVWTFLICKVTIRQIEKSKTVASNMKWK